MEWYKTPCGGALRTRGLGTTVVAFVWLGRCNNKNKNYELMAGKLACICKKNGRVHLLISMAVCRNFSELGWGWGGGAKNPIIIKLSKGHLKYRKDLNNNMF